MNSTNLVKALFWAVVAFVAFFCAVTLAIRPSRADSIHINQGGQPSHVANTSKATSTASSTASAHSRAHSSATASGGQGIGLGGSATGGAASASGGQSSASGFGGSSDSHDRVVIAPGLAGLTGTTCMGSTTASVGFAGFGGGLGTTWEDKQCTRRENIKIVSQFDQSVARRMLLGLDGVADAYAEVYTTGGGSTAGLMAHNQPAWCEGRDLRTASAFDKEQCQ